MTTGFFNLIFFFNAGHDHQGSTQTNDCNTQVGGPLTSRPVYHYGKGGTTPRKIRCPADLKILSDQCLSILYEVYSEGKEFNLYGNFQLLWWMVYIDAIMPIPANS